MASIFDFLKRLFSRRRPSPRPPTMAFGGGEAVVDGVAEAPTRLEPEPGPIPEAEPVAEPVSNSATELLDFAAGRTVEADKEGDDTDEEEELDDLPAEEESDEDDPLAPDPFVSPDAPAIEALSPDAVSQQRAAAMAAALTGEHKVFLAESAGPGSLAEALNLLAQQGRVAAEFREDDAEGPYLLYRAIETPQHGPPGAG